MKKIAIIGSGPTGIYTFYSLLKNASPLSVSVFEQADEAGVGMPYNDDDNSRLMLANIASIEIPPLFMTYLDWLKRQSEAHLARFKVDKATLHDRQFLPRILLGEYFRDSFQTIVQEAKRRGFQVEIHTSATVTDVAPSSSGVTLSVNDSPFPERFDLAVIATGHVWPEEEEATRAYFPSPWSGLMDARIRPCRVGIMGTSLSGLDAAMAVVMQHGEFRDGTFLLDKGSEALKIVLMSRTGILPEADFYCPIPYEPLSVLTESVLEAEIAKGSDGLLDRIFALMVKELELADPAWCEKISLRMQTADSLREAWFEDRKQHGPFTWAEENLNEVERNKRDRRTVAWRYTVLRLHEVVQEMVPHLTGKDAERFKNGLHASLSTTMPPFPRSRFAGFSRFVRPASLALWRWVMITRWILAARRRSSPQKKRPTVSTSLLMPAGKSRLKQKICPSRRCASSYRRRAMRSRILARITR